MSTPTKRPRGRPRVAAPREVRSIRLPPAVWQQVETEAKRRKMSQGRVIELAMRVLGAKGDGA